MDQFQRHNACADFTVSSQLHGLSYDNDSYLFWRNDLRCVCVLCRERELLEKYYCLLAALDYQHFKLTQDEKLLNLMVDMTSDVSDERV
jgi:hypothetical protein